VKPKVFGIGLPRTASRSVYAAVCHLGWGRLLQDPVDWNRIDRAPGAFDITIASRYRELDERYPGSKFILTLRLSDSWLKGIRKLYRRWAPLRNTTLPPRGANPRRYKWWILEAERAVWGAAGWTRIPSDREFLQGRIQHHDGVREYFADRPQDLLEFDVFAGDGYEKLSAFLGAPVPKRKFPHIKDTW
jgi:hypothetical protein